MNGQDLLTLLIELVGREYVGRFSHFSV